MNPIRIEIAGLSVAEEIVTLVNEEVAPGTGVDPERFWVEFAGIIADLAPKNRQLLEKRASIEQQINAWHQAHPGAIEDRAAYKAFLEKIGYLVAEGGDFEITTTGVDAEIATLAGPQLVVPVSNARYALNAANARWGSLYDAYYGTDLIPEDGGCEKV
ncbi:MAG: hypothetical protein ACSLE2_16225, partial [Lysobacterales bacterium]